MGKLHPKVEARRKRVKRIRKKIAGTLERPRLRVFKSTRHIYGQIVDDSAGHTIVAVSTLTRGVVADSGQNKTEKARQVGMMLAAKAKEKGVEKVVFDRGGYIYHGRVKALSEGAREGGLVF